MTGVTVGGGAKRVTILGHGVRMSQEFELASDIKVIPVPEPPDLEHLAQGCENFRVYAGIVFMREVSTFAIEVDDPAGGRSLTIRAWNALWQFHLLSLACEVPCTSLYSVSRGDKETYAISNPTIDFRPQEKIPTAETQQLAWAQLHQNSFRSLIRNAQFSTAMRCFGNAHSQLDSNVQVMLLWSGVECLLSVDAELKHRLALYGALLLGGSTEQTVETFQNIKKAYNIRSRVVHGSEIDSAKLSDGCKFTSWLLARLLRKCVELGRIPKLDELESLAFGKPIT